jgi:hypothetical protein
MQSHLPHLPSAERALLAELDGLAEGLRRQGGGDPNAVASPRAAPPAASQPAGRCNQRRHVATA